MNVLLNIHNLDTIDKSMIRLFFRMSECEFIDLANSLFKNLCNLFNNSMALLNYPYLRLVEQNLHLFLHDLVLHLLVQLNKSHVLKRLHRVANRFLRTRLVELHYFFIDQILPKPLNFLHHFFQRNQHVVLHHRVQVLT